MRVERRYGTEYSEWAVIVIMEEDGDKWHTVVYPWTTLKGEAMQAHADLTMDKPDFEFELVRRETGTYVIVNNSTLW